MSPGRKPRGNCCGNEKPVEQRDGFEKDIDDTPPVNGGLFLPRTLLVAIRLQALPALVLVHLQSTFLFQVAHGV
jgi:hypothetical protein